MNTTSIDPHSHPNGEVLLSECAKKIAEHHHISLSCNRASEEQGNKSVQSAVIAGENLIAAKTLIPHGQWLNWIKECCPDLSEETCQRYMRLAKASHVTDFEKVTSLRQAYILSGIIDPDTSPKKKSPAPKGKAEIKANKLVRKLMEELEIEYGFGGEPFVTECLQPLLEWYEWNGMKELKKRAKRMAMKIQRLTWKPKLFLPCN
jgi:hypothetical protein